MTDSEMIRQIRLTPKFEKLWDSMDKDERRLVLEEAGGDTWRLDEIMESVIDDREN